MHPPNHFFKFIPPSFRFNPSIPKSFLMKLNEKRCNTAILRRGDREWPVDISDKGIFSDGWRKFVIENGVQELDSIVFKHQGNMVFDFWVFDPSTCERQYPSLFHEMDVEEEPLSQKRSNKRKRSEYTSQSKDKFGLENDRCFMMIMTPYYIKTPRLVVPMKFARSNGLITQNIRTQAVLMDEAQRTWPATLDIKKTKILLTVGRILITKNHLEVGDTLMFKLIKLEEMTPVFKIYNLGKKPAEKMHKQVKTATSNNNRYFISTLKPCSNKKSCLFLPDDFSMQNGLKMGEMILRDDEGRSWNVNLNRKGEKAFYLGTGFRDFCDVNGLKEGDMYKFELLENKKDMPPVVRFSCTNLPFGFSISNGLKMGEMILRDDEGRLWNGKLNKKGDKYIYLTGCSIRDYCAANGLKEGDAFKFELIENEKNKPPVANFSYLGTNPIKNHIQAKKETDSTIKKVTSSTTKKGTSSTCNDQHYFISTLKSCSFKNSCLYLPSGFSLSNGLKMGEMILRDDKGRLWNVNLKKRCDKYLYLTGCGIRDCCAANGLKEGDAYKFELVENGKNMPPIVNFSVNIHSTPSREGAYPYFVGEVKSYNLEKWMLYLPNKFARRNGLFNKEEMILKNVKNERSWTVKVKRSASNYCYIGGGWQEFVVENGLQEGHRFKLELVNNGEKPIANFYFLNIY